MSIRVLERHRTRGACTCVTGGWQVPTTEPRPRHPRPGVRPAPWNQPELCCCSEAVAGGFPLPQEATAFCSLQAFKD